MRLPILSSCFAFVLAVGVTLAAAQEAAPTEEAPAVAEQPVESPEAGTPEPSSTAEATGPATEAPPAEGAAPSEEPAEPAAEEADPSTETPDPAESAGVEAPAESPTDDDAPADAATADDAPSDDAATEDSVSDEPAADEELTADDGSSDDAAEAADEAPTTDWSALLERSPAFLSLLHYAAVHMPIALWIFGALFVVIGVVVPSVRTQIPLASLLIGTVTAVAATVTGWCLTIEFGDAWNWGDPLGDFSEQLVQHRWMGVALVFGGVVFSILALISQAKKSKWLGAIWRIGLLLLAAGVAWEGHVGGELIHGEGFLEDAYEEWVNPEE